MVAKGYIEKLDKDHEYVGKNLLIIDSNFEEGTYERENYMGRVGKCLGTLEGVNGILFHVVFDDEKGKDWGEFDENEVAVWTEENQKEWEKENKITKEKSENFDINTKKEKVS